MKSILTILLCLYISIAWAQQVPITPEPNWTKKNSFEIDWTNDNNTIGSEAYHLLIDLQMNIPEQTKYYHRATKVLNTEGVQAWSDISATYDPEYQEIYFHKVKVYRNGEVIDKLKDHKIRTLQNERGRERYLYDSRLNVVLNLRDIRVGDIIVYSYSCKGFNPAYDGHLASNFDLDFGSPIHKITNRLITRSDRKVKLKYNQVKIEPVVSNTPGRIEYLWERNNIAARITDNNLPQWYDPYTEVAYSDYGSWAEVIQSLLPLYELESSELKAIRLKVKEDVFSNKEDTLINQAIHFVQDEIRYLGFENGIHAFKPHSPMQVLEQRFGDCKDKSFLLCAILNSYAIEAHPVLVNTYLGSHTKEELPGFNAFNHCVAQIKLDTGYIYIDPTINHQGGVLGNVTFPDYGVGLVIRPESKGLTLLTKSSNRGTKTSVKINIPNEKDSVTLQVITRSYDSEADGLRSYFSTTDINQIDKYYLGYYSGEYLGIKLVNKVMYSDNRTDNEFTTEEEYIFPNPSKRSEQTIGKYEFDFYAIDLANHIYVPKSPERTMPYKSPNRNDYELDISITFPSPPTGYEGEQVFESKDYKYTYDASILGNELSIYHLYQTLSTEIPAGRVSKYIASHVEMRNYLTHELEFDPESEMQVTISKLMSVFMCILLLIGSYISYKLYYLDKAPKYALRKDKPLGGFLLVIAAVIFFNAILKLISVFDLETYLNANFWLWIESVPKSNSNEIIRLLVGSNLVYEIFELSFLILLFVLLLKKRTTFPKFTTYYLFINLAYTIVYAVLLEGNDGASFNIQANFNTLVSTVIVSLITFAYFKHSQRIESTFIHTLKHEK